MVWRTSAPEMVEQLLSVFQIMKGFFFFFFFKGTGYTIERAHHLCRRHIPGDRLQVALAKSLNADASGLFPSASLGQISDFFQPFLKALTCPFFMQPHSKALFFLIHS